MCFGDSDLTSTANDTYIGSVSFPALVSEPENTIVVSSDYGAPLEVISFDLQSHLFIHLTFCLLFVFSSLLFSLFCFVFDQLQSQLEVDLTMSGGQYSCISTYASNTVKTVIANIIFNRFDYFNQSMFVLILFLFYSILFYHSTEANSAVDLLFVVKYVTAPLGNCIQIGGSVERCNNLFAWPAEWNTDAVNGQLYTATIDVSSANYDWPEGQYQFCFGNGDPTSGYDEFLGTVAVQDLINEPALFEVSSSVGEVLTVSDK